MRVSLFIVVAVSLLQSRASAAELLPLADFLKQWEISKQFTLDVARSMPEEHYTFKPTPEQMTFGAQMVHIAASLRYRFAEIRGEKPDVEHLRKMRGKNEILAALADAYDDAIATLRKVTPEQLARNFKVGWKGRPDTDGRNMIMNMFVHAAHHRAQCEVYLRLKGITPPQYTF
jgi:uncharacterized damage-inducible protein DinB